MPKYFILAACFVTAFDSHRVPEKKKKQESAMQSGKKHDGEKKKQERNI
jgi:hypothetical protein